MSWGPLTAQVVASVFVGSGRNRSGQKQRGGQGLAVRDRRSYCVKRQDGSRRGRSEKSKRRGVDCTVVGNVDVGDGNGNGDSVARR